MNRRGFLGLLAAPLAAADVPVENSAMRGELRRMEQALEASFGGLGETAPMQTLGLIRGIYLPDYGAVFSLQVNLVPMANISPFRQAYTDEEKRKLNVRKRSRLEDLEMQMRGVLIDHGGKLMRVPRDQKVAVAASLFHFPWEERTKLPEQMILAAKRDDLTALSTGRVPRTEAKALVDLTWY